MSVNSISTGVISASIQQSPRAERAESHENDGDQDDAKSASGVAAAASRSVNLSGQATGQVVHSVA